MKFLKGKKKKFLKNSIELIRYLEVNEGGLLIKECWSYLKVVTK